MAINFKELGKTIGGGAIGGAVIVGGSKLFSVVKEKVQDLPAKARLKKALKSKEKPADPETDTTGETKKKK